jgi:3-aminobutyryl-CoA ammonia-lyase
MKRGTIRLRMSVADTHYAGNLVSGARIIELMSDAGTELQIMYSGNEGLLACWKHIEQFEPVYLGDYIEVKAWFSRFGNTSADFEAEVYKVAAPAAQGAGEGACDIIDPSVLVAKGSGVGVTPKNINRGLQVPKEAIPYEAADGRLWWENRNK